MDKWRIMEAEKRMTQGLERLRHIKMWSFQDAREFITVSGWRQDRAEQFLNLIDEAEKRGFASPYLGIKNLESTLRLEMMNSFHVVDHAGGVTGLGSMVFVPADGYRSWRIYNPTILTANLDRGGFSRINGVPGVGKTNTGCVIQEQFASEPNHVAIGNIRMLAPTPNFIYVKDAESLVRVISDLPYKTSWHFVHDEGGLSYSKPDQATRRVKDLDKLMRCVRKLGGSYTLIEQREDSVPNLIVEFAKNIYYVEAKGVVSIEMRGPELAFRDTVRDFPKTKLPFDTDDIAMFDINIDVQKLFSQISGADDPKSAMRDFLNLKEEPLKPRKCNSPGCEEMFIEKDGRVKYCPKHRRYFDTRTNNTVYPQEEEKPTFQEFLQVPP